MTYDLNTERHLADTLRQRIADNETIYGPGCRPELRTRLADHERNIAMLTAPTTPQPRYVVLRDVIEVPCDHPMCDHFHQRFMEYGIDGRTRFHDAKRVQWLIWDNATDARAGFGETYDTKRDARAALARMTDTI